MYYEINEAAARRAKEANSYNAYKEGSATAEYRRAVDAAAAVAETQKARVDPMYHDKIDSLLDTYSRKLAENMNKGFEIDARVPSIMIAGPSKFPTWKKEKQNAARDKNMRDWEHIQGLLDKVRSTGMGGISSDDPDAIEKLQEKLARLEEKHAVQKAANAYWRKHKTFEGCPGLSDEAAKKLNAQMETAFPWYKRNGPFDLSSNNAEKKRLRERIATLEASAARAESHPDGTEDGYTFDGGRVVRNHAENRLQIIFDGKPDDDTRKILKSRGFKWAPSQGAWQRQLTSNAEFALKMVLEAITKEDNFA
ncbi:MAG: hypothetical protein FWE19_00365 [Oscillospiraceae bacterium]|nr:hypothetical protein [Oscillospiraceae bacterium]